MFYNESIIVKGGFPGGSVVKDPPASAGATGLIPGSGRSPGEENGNLLQYSCLEDPLDREAWWVTVHGVARVGHNLTTKQQQQMLKVGLERRAFVYQGRTVGKGRRNS